MTRLALAAIAFIAAATPSPAKEEKGVFLAQQLGYLVGYAASCKLPLNSDEMEAYISAEIAPDDLDFSREYQIDIGYALSSFKGLSDQDKKMICFQTDRNLRALRLLTAD